MKKLSFILLLLGISVNAQEERLHLYENKEKGYNEYIYPKTIQPLDYADRTSFWIEREYKTPKKLRNGKLYTNEKVQYLINCKKKELGLKSMVIYNKNKVVHSINENEYLVEMESAIPDTNGWGYVTIACEIAEKMKDN